MPPRDKNQAPDTVEARPIEVNGLGLMYEINLTDGRKLSWEVKVDDTIEPDELNERLDLIHKASERQVALSTITAKREKVMVLKVRLQLQEATFAREGALQEARWGNNRKQGGFRRTEAQQTKLDNIETTIAGMCADIPVAEWEVARLEAIIDGRPPPELPQAQLKAALDHMSALPRPGYAQAAE